MNIFDSQKIQWDFVVYWLPLLTLFASFSILDLLTKPSMALGNTNQKVKPETAPLNLDPESSHWTVAKATGSEPHLPNR